ncbi:RNA polymerase sigma factor [Jannaschia sp. R86511]|uniref:RNA polymerase sigma factor n=1 Tax=Jannaschia sp. R86511 TaxID=3093853 RepID=UPI0036D2482C
MTTATADGPGVGPASEPIAGRGLDDGTLVVRARDGDVNAFEVLVQRYQSQMYRLAYRMLGNRGDAEDVVQEVFLAAWRRLPEIREGAALPGWLYRTTTNRCLNVLRARRPRAEVDLDLTESRSPEGEPERAAETAEQVRALTVALQRLTPEQRAAWLLREVHDRSYAEIAGILGVSATAVRGRIARSRVELAEAMQPWR